MKIVYCTHSLYNPGGMERVLLNKVAWLRAHAGHTITIVTTDQHGRSPFYPVPDGVRWVDLGINYSDDNHRGCVRKIAGFLRRRRLHKRRLTRLLCREKADIVVSLYPSESSFIPAIRDGSRKVLELHYCKFFRLQYGRRGLMRLIDRWRTWRDETVCRRFDRFVVLTREDMGHWRNMPRIRVIPNAAPAVARRAVADTEARRVIAVGRLDHQKGFDRLIVAWDAVCKAGLAEGWRLDIFGQGEWLDMLQGMIDERGLGGYTAIRPPTPRIGEEYARSSILAMTSRYEGFPMVLLEGMAHGLAVATFDYKCGPRDLIVSGANGLLVHEGDTCGMARALASLMGDAPLRRRMAANARLTTAAFSEEAVMEQWNDLFTSLAGR